jgi:hypothetical protein
VDTKPVPWSCISVAELQIREHHRPATILFNDINDIFARDILLSEPSFPHFESECRVRPEMFFCPAFDFFPNPLLNPCRRRARVCTLTESRLKGAPTEGSLQLHRVFGSCLRCSNHASSPQSSQLRSRLSVSHSLGSYAALSGHSSIEAVYAGFNALDANFIALNIGSVVPAMSTRRVSVNRSAVANITIACTGTQDNMRSYVCTAD